MAAAANDTDLKLGSDGGRADASWPLMSTSLIHLPSEVLMEIIAYLGVTDGELYRLALVCRDLHKLNKEESLCEVLARQLFPSETLKLTSSPSATTTTGTTTAAAAALSTPRDASSSQPPAADSPYTSWRALLMDGNAANGLYVKRIQGAVSLWVYNSSRRFFVNSVRRMAWDASQKQVHLLVDAYGHSDLREAHTTSVYRNRRQLQPLSYRYLCRSPGHQVCVLTYCDSDFCYEPPLEEDDDDILAITCFRYVYNGGGLEGTDYPTTTIFHMTRESSLKSMFQLRSFLKTSHDLDDMTAGGGRNGVSFESRPLSYRHYDTGNRDNSSSQLSQGTQESGRDLADAATNATDADDLLHWEGFSLPPAILELRQRGRWGDRYRRFNDGSLRTVRWRRLVPGDQWIPDEGGE